MRTRRRGKKKKKSRIKGKEKKYIELITMSQTIRSPQLLRRLEVSNPLFVPHFAINHDPRDCVRLVQG